ncbi:MAG: hypothetical protein IT431_04840 [Phycisphaerales bacterium]|nr:hypothetical protein [Phycisphaerales bacterium]
MSQSIAQHTEPTATPPSDEAVRRLAEKPGWYHTIEVAPGVRTRGAYDHTPWLAHYRFPESLRAWTVLDVGASEGYFAYHLESLGAERVVAVDTDEFDGSVAIDPSRAHTAKYAEKYRRRAATNAGHEETYRALGVPVGNHRLAAAALRRSAVDFRTGDVYKLDGLGGPFDLVFCGDLLTHLKHPIAAAEQLALATGRLCIVALADALPPGPDAADARRCEYVGNVSGGAFFHFTPECLRELLLASGFASVEIVSRFDLPDRARGIVNPHAVLHCRREPA